MGRTTIALAIQGVREELYGYEDGAGDYPDGLQHGEVAAFDAGYKKALADTIGNLELLERMTESA